ncbi:MAG TPA: FHA domain-containing protein [Solirubrobacteraceae bacterium]|nr:FHA domain-containing protein [Solirubrobacteraceae bacterium]
MLCPDCRRQVSRGAAFCGTCGSPIGAGDPPLELVLSSGERVALIGDVVIGRSPASTLRLDDPSVSRTHARISAGEGAARIEDAGSSHGTYVDGTRVERPLALRDGARIRVGDQELGVERRRELAEAGRTLVVRPGSTLVVSAAGAAPQATQYGMRPRVRSGYALKRMDADEGPRRWVLRDLSRDSYLRLSDNDAALFELLDGSRSLIDLIGECERRFGPTGAARLARLLADLGERGFLAGVASAAADAERPASFWRRLVTPREKVVHGVGPFFDALYRRGGWLLFTRPLLWAIAVLCVVGVVVFGLLVGLRYGTPFVVAGKIGIGGLVFLLGRFLVVAVHETAHGLAMASFGRRVEKAGLKLIAIFPFAFVDTSEAWFEPRRRRIAISAAGPVADFSLGAIFSICCLALPEGNVRDIFFQLAFAGYVGAFFNLNPFLERDGYHMLVDWLREPGLRRRARDQFARRLSGRPKTDDSPVLARYSLWGLAWSVLAAGFAIGMTLRFEPVMTQLAPPTVVHVVMGTLWAAFFVPVLVVVGKPLWDRARGRVGT